jgi:hypothetical protein
VSTTPKKIYCPGNNEKYEISGFSSNLRPWLVNLILGWGFAASVREEPNFTEEDSQYDCRLPVVTHPPTGMDISARNFRRRAQNLRNNHIFLGRSLCCHYFSSIIFCENHWLHSSVIPFIRNACWQIHVIITGHSHNPPP